MVAWGLLLQSFRTLPRPECRLLFQGSSRRASAGPVSPSHTLPLRFRRTPALSFAPVRNPRPATHRRRPSIDSFKAPSAPERRRKTGWKDPTICNCRNHSSMLSASIAQAACHNKESPRPEVHQPCTALSCYIRWSPRLCLVEAPCGIEQILKEVCLGR